VTEQINVVHNFEALLRQLRLFYCVPFHGDAVFFQRIMDRLDVGIYASYFETLTPCCRKEMPSTAAYLQETPTAVKVLIH